MSEGALGGLVVIDLSRVLGGPYCTMILADHGAEVIKIEPPQGDETREWGPPFAEGTASYFLGVNRNKKGLALDLARAEGREALLRLLAGADVLVENFKPGTMEKWNLGYVDLAARFPRLIHCRISGFGAEGPLGGLPGYDAVLQAMLGLMSINGDDGTGPLRLGTPVVDLATGLYSAIAILMALQERARSGFGQFLDMTLYDCGLALLHPHAANFLLDGKRPRALGNAHPNIAPYETFPTRQGMLFLAIGNDGQFIKLCDMLGVPELAADPRFAANRDRLANRSVLRAALTAALAEQDAGEIAPVLLRAGLPAAKVAAIDEALSAPHTHTRAMVAELGAFRAVGTPIKLSRTPGGTRSEPPAFNAHGRAILRAHGFSDEEIARLATEGIVPEARRQPAPRSP